MLLERQQHEDRLKRVWFCVLPPVIGQVHIYTYKGACELLKPALGFAYNIWFWILVPVADTVVSALWKCMGLILGTVHFTPLRCSLCGRELGACELCACVAMSYILARWLAISWGGKCRRTGPYTSIQWCMWASKAGMRFCLHHLPAREHYEWTSLSDCLISWKPHTCMLASVSVWPHS